LAGPRYADFHALRHSYLSALAAAGVGVKELQELARHSDPRLTLGIYTHARAESLGGAVARLQVPGAGEGNPLAKLSRAELESAVIALACVVRMLTDPESSPGYTVDTPRDTPNSGTSEDRSGPCETVEAGRASA
jgi:hypothetical protein